MTAKAGACIENGTVGRIPGKTIDKATNAPAPIPDHPWVA
jgi:hypothetical protein